MSKKPDKPPAKKPDKRTELRRLSDVLAKAYVAELEARRKHQDIDEVRFGARTPTPEDLASIRAAHKVHVTKTRQRMAVEAQIADLLGLKSRGKPPGELLDRDVSGDVDSTE